MEDMADRDKILVTGISFSPVAPVAARFKMSCMSRTRVLALALTLSLLFWLGRGDARAAEPVVETVTESETTTSASATGDHVQSLFPFLISLGVHAGYDSNSQTTSNSQGSAFASEELTVSYDRTHGATQIGLVAGLAVIERFSRNTDVNALLNLTASHQISPRLSLSGSIDSAYRAEPDFSSDVGPNQRAGNYFRSSEQIAATYRWTDRFSTVTSYSFRLIRYENSTTAFFTDRNEHTIGEEFRFDLSRQTVLLADYRFLVVDYDSVPRDSTTHFLLAGVEQTFSRRLTAQLRAGASLRSFDEGEDSTDPNVEGSASYALGRDSSLTWNIRYGVEEPGIQEAMSRETFRTGLQFAYRFTPKISSAATFYYHHDENTTGGVGVTSGTAFTTDAFDLLLVGRYQITRHLDLDISYGHSEVSSGGTGSNYSRNRYAIGMTFTF